MGYNEILVNNTNLGLNEESKIFLKPAEFPLSGVDGFWKLDGDATEEISGVTSTVSGVTWTTGIDGQAGLFTGTTSSITVGDQDDFRFYSNQPFSISLWHYTPIITGSTSNYLITKWTPLQGIQLDRAGKKIAIRLGSFLIISTAEPFEDEKWYNVVLTFDGVAGSNGYNVYVNTSDINVGTTNVGTIDADTPLVIGNNYGLNGPANGKLDEIGIWDRVLSETEIRTLYNNGQGTFY